MLDFLASATPWILFIFALVAWAINTFKYEMKLRDKDQELKDKGELLSNPKNFPIYVQMRGEFKDYHARFYFDIRTGEIIPDPKGVLSESKVLPSFCKKSVLKCPDWRVVEGKNRWGQREIIFDFPTGPALYFTPIFDSILTDKPRSFPDGGNYT